MKIHTTIAKTYVSKWGAAEGIREIMQNALDSRDRGHDMGVTYLRDKRRLMIFNRGARLDRRDLLLGQTTKSDDSAQRGQYGEGMKLSALALIRAGKPVVIYNGDAGERWDCTIENSPDFDTEVLTFGIDKTSLWKTHRGKLVFEINNITPEEWHAMRTLFLNIYAPDKKTVLQTPEGDVLLDKGLKGRIYCGGIYVDTDKDLLYGYDFKPGILELNRDRNMVSSFDLRWNTSKVWAYLSANRKGKLYDAMALLKTGGADVEYMKEFADYTVKGKVVEDFFKENTPKSYPVKSDEEAKEIRRLGYDPVYSGGSYAGIIRDKLGTIEDLKRTVELDYSLFQELTPIDDANIKWCFEVMWKLDNKFVFDMKVAKFGVDSTRSISDGKSVVINSNLIMCKFEILHEVIRHYCGIVKTQESQIWKQLYKQTLYGMSTPA